MSVGGGVARAQRETAAYYGAKVRRWGATPQGADWRCQATQEMRFVQLLRIAPAQATMSLNDLGCGWGALLHFLGRRRMLRRVDYLGIDLSEEMVQAARRARPRHASRFVTGTTPPRVADYSVASGIFNVMLDLPTATWEAFVRDTLSSLRESSRLGFAVNFMEPVPPPIEACAGLYRPEPARWIAYMEKALGVEVETVAGYGLREVTLLARVR
jgi:hypothetical protein